MKIRIVMNGAVTSCCSSYPPDLVKEIVSGWLGQGDELEVIDRQQEKQWQPDALVALAERYFKDAVYPAVYVDEKLVTLGDIPDRESLLKLGSGRLDFGVTEKDILEAARRHGLLEET